ncbi:uncharacterized protein Z518_08204 [Rhinocladiella mackenziei CBS 650.93]|uniref:TauD/TfdA-like domain-containing protein n=1 Tax=Rhinocladiella mackenziei CBS 650.93 TaxID=1442369 RepID=A0A0D2J046_9EURO|nr:uncharacterized protein Z518_08204 [Rhinocladiella mackenziei CBS 650.93]KIX02265.1 hypothetical protein Z518_08204 [Rhinocladiella mackenziei CBS 650.93]
MRYLPFKLEPGHLATPLKTRAQLLSTIRQRSRKPRELGFRKVSSNSPERFRSWKIGPDDPLDSGFRFIRKHLVRPPTSRQLNESPGPRLRKISSASSPPPLPPEEGGTQFGSNRSNDRASIPSHRPETLIQAGKLLDHGRPVVSPILARDACRCSKCIDPSDRQRQFSYANIPTNISFRDITHVPGKNDTLVRWLHDAEPHEPGDPSIFTEATIANLKNEFRNRTRWAVYDRPQKLWDAESFRRETTRIEFNDYMNDRPSLAAAVHLLWRDGLVFIDGVPESESSVAAIVNRIGPLMQTFYGPTWDVRSVPNAKNVAYTSKYLGFHMDLLYMRDPPGFQFLHYVHNSSEGGESRFADTFRAVDTLYTENKAHVHTLTHNEVRYEYDNDGFFYSDSKPTILRRSKLNLPSRNPIGAVHPTLMREVGHVFWSPPFVGNLSPHLGHEQLVKFVTASKAFADILERPENVVEEKMDSGTCVIFDNLRIVHARNAFDLNSGRRWLRGAYLNRQDFISKAVSLMPDMPVVRNVPVDPPQEYSNQPFNEGGQSTPYQVFHVD